MSLKKQAQATAKELKAKLDEETAIYDRIDNRIAEAEKAKGDVKAASQLTADEETRLRALQTEIKELDDRCAQFNEYADARDRHESMRKALNTPGNPPDYGNPRDPHQEQKQHSIGQQFIESKEWKEYVEFLKGGGERVPDTRFGIDSPNVEVKTLLTGTELRLDGGSGIVRPDYQGIVPFFLRPLSMRDIVTVGSTDSDQVDFTRITGFTNNAAPTAEATTGALDSSSGMKPESAISTEHVKENVRTIPHWIPVTRRALADAAQMRTYIDNFLIQGAEIVLEDQMVTGDGTGENLLGLDNTPNITLQAPILTSGDVDFLKTARQARTKVRTVGRAVANAYVMHPEDWEQFDVLTAGTTGQFYFGGPMQMGSPRLWGLPVVESEAILKGTFYVGDMKQAVLWDRERANIRVSDSPNNYFLRNIVAILCQLRAAFGVLRPPAIVRGDFVEGANS